jgi:hypothetical protein
MEIVSKEQADNLDKHTNVSIISELENYKYLIKYNGKLSDSIRESYSKDPLITFENKNYSKKEIKKSG